MDLVSVRTSGAASAGSRARLLGEVVYDDRPGEPEEYWFEVPEQWAGSLSLSGNPWLACLLPLAVTLGEPLRLCVPVDPELRAGVARVMQTWARMVSPAPARGNRGRVETVGAGRGPARDRRLLLGRRRLLLHGPVERRRGARRRAPADRPPCHRVGVRHPAGRAGGVPPAPVDASRRRARARPHFLDASTNLRDDALPRGALGQSRARVRARRRRPLARARCSRRSASRGRTTDGPVSRGDRTPRRIPLLSTGVTRFVPPRQRVRAPRRRRSCSHGSDVAMRHLHVCYRIALGRELLRLPQVLPDDAHPGGRSAPARRDVPPASARPAPRIEDVIRSNAVHRGSTATSPSGPGRRQDPRSRARSRAASTDRCRLQPLARGRRLAGDAARALAAGPPAAPARAPDSPAVKRSGRRLLEDGGGARALSPGLGLGIALRASRRRWPPRGSPAVAASARSGWPPCG